MPMQSQVNLFPSIGVEGDLAVPDQAIYHALQLTAEEPVKVGSFVFEGSNPEIYAKQSGEKLVGLVQRNLSYIDYDELSSGSLVVNEGSTLTIAVRGDFYVRTTTQATIGQKVFADKTSGAILTGNEGTSIAGCVETQWRVKTPGNADDLIVISSW